VQDTTAQLSKEGEVYVHSPLVEVNLANVAPDAVFRNRLSVPRPALPFHLLPLFLASQAGCHMLAALSRRPAQNTGLKKRTKPFYKSPAATRSHNAAQGIAMPCAVSLGA
jgi:hypothetical protein